MTRSFDLPILNQALEVLFASHGLCFHLSSALVLDLPDSELRMGTFRAATPEERAKMPQASPEPFIHCWVEHEGVPYNTTLIERYGALFPLPRAEFYRLNEIKNVYVIQRPQLLMMCPELEVHLTTGLPMKDGRALGSTLAQIAGMPYRVSPRNTLLPA